MAPGSDGQRLLSDLTPQASEALAAASADPSHMIVALDFDGTLAPIVPDPTQARAHPQAISALGRVAEHVGRVAVVTGRPAALAVELGGLGDVPGLVVLGLYGLQRWEDGTLTAPDPPPGVEAARAELPDVIARHAPGAEIEDKGSALAVHTRRASHPTELFDALVHPIAELAARHGLAVEPGRLVLEIRPPGIDKGDAVRRLVGEIGASCVLFAGDDLGDLAAFDAVAQLRGEGVPGLLVCSGSDEVTALAERADVVVDGPAGMVALLDEIADLLAAGR